ncbi:MAG: succinate--CoA ligase subunit alpha [Candidatus Coatesbacteria bacterium]|nr:MAG: succinate--CoA ligase subunit alpha [Candidatus Coatesbacteria bacterium]
MSILIDENTKLVVQGITGRDGLFHTGKMVEYGTNVVAGVTPGKGGTDADGIPVFNLVAEAVEATGANTSIMFVPEAFAADAIYEAIDAGIGLLVVITEGVPVQEMNKIYKYAAENGSRFVGPNCPGVISPGKSKVGIMPAQIHEPGPIGVVSRSGTLTYEIVYNLTRAGLGQSTCIGIGGDPVVGTGFIDCLEMFEADAETTGVVLIGEIGGDDEERAAEYVQTKMSKPVVSFIAGRTAPPGKRMGHAGAIISGGKGTAESKREALTAAGVAVADTPSQIPILMKEALG